MKRFAEAIKLAARIREDSFDQKKADKMEISKSMIKPFHRCYTKSLYDSTDEAACKLGYDKRATQPIYLLLAYTWNDVLDWADTID